MDTLNAKTFFLRSYMNLKASVLQELFLAVPATVVFLIKSNKYILRSSKQYNEWRNWKFGEKKT